MTKRRNWAPRLPDPRPWLAGCLFAIAGIVAAASWVAEKVRQRLCATLHRHRPPGSHPRKDGGHDA